MHRNSDFKEEMVMKLIVEQTASGDEEVIVRYSSMTTEVEETIRFLQGMTTQIIGKRIENNKEKRYLLSPQKILYIESVDNLLFAYTKTLEYQIEYTLSEFEENFAKIGFFRCNKSFVINVKKIQAVRSEMGNRIDATLENGEHIIISRRYAKEFREMIRKGDYNE